MSQGEKHRTDPSECGAALLELAAHGAAFDPMRVLGLDKRSATHVQEKLQDFRLASVLVALLAEEGHDPRLLAVREEVERRVFPPTADEGREALARAKSTMAAVGELLIAADDHSGNPKTLSWARGWLSEIGIDVTNPVRLDLLAIHCLRFYADVTSLLRTFESG